MEATPKVRAGIGKNMPETTVWVATRPNDGRGFGCTGAHYHFNWAQNDFRKTILNCIVWTAHVEVHTMQLRMVLRKSFCAQLKW